MTKVRNLLDAIRSKDIAHEVVQVVVRTAVKGTTRSASRMEIFLDQWCLDDLTEEGQEVMLKREVNFQGKEMRLRNLEKSWTSIQKDVAADLLSSEKEFLIGRRIEEPEEGMMARRLSHYNMVCPRVLNEVAALNGGRLALGGFPQSLLEDVARSNGLLQFIKNEDVASVLKDNVRWHVIYYENEPSPVVSKEFLRNLVKDRAVGVIHWVEFVSGVSADDLCMEWRMSLGSSVEIQPFIQPLTKDCSSQQPLCVHESVESFKELDKALLVGPAGQGKTTTLSCLAWRLKQEEPLEWVVNVKILEHRELLREWMELKVLTLDHVVELLAAATGVESTGSSRSFLAAALKTSGAMSVFLDGWDEVAPVFSDLTERVLDLLMNQTSIKRVWVACRPQVAAPLRRVMQTPSLALQDLTQLEQRHFLNSRFNAVSGEEEKLWAEQVVQLIENTGDMLGIPLHLQMAADVYQEKWTPGIEHESSFTLFELYDEFVKRKLKQYERRYTLLPEESTSFYEKNEKLAVFYLFSDEPSAKALPLDEFKHLVLNDDVFLHGLKEGTGIVWMEGHTVHYSHQTYAEYFAAKWLFRTADASPGVRDFVRGMLRGELAAKSRVQLFLEDQLSRQWPFHAAALRCHMKEVERLLQGGRWALEHWDRRDALLQWDFGECVRHAFRDSIKLFPEESSFHSQWLVLAFRAAVESSCPSVVGEVMRRAKLPPSTLSYALRAAVDAGDIEVTRVLLEHGVKDTYSRLIPILHLAVCRGKLSMVDLLLNHSLDVNERDAVGEIALHYALGFSVSSHQHDISQRLLKESSVDVTTEGAHGQSLLSLASSSDCSSCVQSLLRRGAQVNNGDALPLLSAAQENNIDMLRFLLDEGAVVNATDKNGDTALHIAAGNGQMESVELLLFRGANINCRNINGLTPSDDAKLSKEKEVVKFLQNHMYSRKKIKEKSILANLEIMRELKRAAQNGDKDITLEILQRATPSLSALNAALRAAAEGATTGHTEVTRILLQHGANDSTKEKELSSLRRAAMGGNVATLELLLEKFNDFNTRDFLGFTPLHCAIGNKRSEHRHDATQRLLREEALDVDAEQGRGFTPLCHACQVDCVSCVKALQHRGAKVDGITKLPLFICASLNSINSMRVLLQSGAQVNATDPIKSTALHRAALSGEKEIVRLLIFEGADLNLKECDGNTAMDVALQRGRRDIANLLKEQTTSEVTKRCLFESAKKNDTSDLETLLKQGTIPNVRDEKQNTALHWASRKGHQAAVLLLLNHGASVYSANSVGSSPLHYASWKGHTQVAELLLQRGANVNSRDKNGVTPLHHASSEGHVETMELLLQHGAQVDAPDSKGNIPQHIVTRKRHLKAVDLLLQRGAKVNTANGEGDSILHVAAKEGDEEVVEFLLNAGANKRMRNKAGMTPLQLAAQNKHKQCAEILRKGK